MFNEFLFAATILLDLAVVLLAFRLGRTYLMAVIVVNLILVSLTAGKIGLVFGFAASPQSIFYAAIFLGTDLITEHYGKRVGYEVVWGGFVALALLIGLGQVVVYFEPLPVADQVAGAINVLFGLAPQIAAASFIAYVVAQNFDIWFFHYIKDRTSGRHLWLRNNLSTFTSQAIDTVIFFPIAFAGIMPWSTILQLMAVAYVVKLVVALADTPFMYLGKSFLPTELRTQATPVADVSTA